MPFQGLELPSRHGRNMTTAKRATAFRPVKAIVILSLVFVTGLAGYCQIEKQTLTDAIYTTTIILSTVGLATGELAKFSEAGKLFTSLLIWGGVGTYAYLLTQMVGFVVSGELNEVVRMRKMEKVISSLNGHILVCGTSDASEQAIAEVYDGATPIVVIAGEKSHLEVLRSRFGELLSVEGLPTEAQTLKRANIASARAVLACMQNDAENLFLVMTARELAPKCLIVAQAYDPATIDKLCKVGADHVVAAAVIAGTRMASVALRPNAMAFLDVMVRSGEEALRLEEVSIPKGSKWIGATLADVQIPQHTKLLVMGMRHSKDSTGGFVFNPSATAKLDAEDKLIVLGSPAQRTELEKLLNKHP